jgi:hypothetical protein
MVVVPEPAELENTCLIVDLDTLSRPDAEIDQIRVLGVC